MRRSFLSGGLHPKMLLIMKDIRKEQREEQHIISLLNNQGWKNNQNNTTPKTIPNTIVFNDRMLHQIINQYQY